MAEALASGRGCGWVAKHNENIMIIQAVEVLSVQKRFMAYVFSYVFLGASYVFPYVFTSSIYNFNRLSS